jgi:phosphopantothenoylcysteine decarboxylase/phosphopantothenate--cysteine ligase
MKIMNPDLPLKGKRVLVSAGPTYEPIDPVRFIGNHSSGKMGYAIAEAFTKVGANVTLVSGPVSLQTPSKVNRIDINTAEQMRDICLKESQTADIIVMAAAVADYKVENQAELKIKKDNHLTLNLVKNPDILKELGETKKDTQTLIGFALETHNGREYAKDKVVRKNLDFVVLNSLSDEGAGFGHDTNKVCLLDKTGTEKNYPLMSKKMVADIIVKQAICYHFSGNFADI